MLKFAFRRAAFAARRGAGVAQLVEQRIRNAKVGSSTLLAGTILFHGGAALRALAERAQALRPVVTGSATRSR
jgi:hypothetical protein